jgi:hypothetical protein
MVDMLKMDVYSSSCPTEVTWGLKLPHVPKTGAHSYIYKLWMYIFVTRQAVQYVTRRIKAIACPKSYDYLGALASTNVPSAHQYNPTSNYSTNRTKHARL